MTTAVNSGLLRDLGVGTIAIQRGGVGNNIAVREALEEVRAERCRMEEKLRIDDLSTGAKHFSRRKRRFPPLYAALRS